MRDKNGQQSSKGVCSEGGIGAVRYCYEDEPDRGSLCGTCVGFGSCLLSLAVNCVACFGYHLHCTSVRRGVEWVRISACL